MSTTNTSTESQPTESSEDNDRQIRRSAAFKMKVVAVIVVLAIIGFVMGALHIGGFFATHLLGLNLTMLGVVLVLVLAAFVHYRRRGHADVFVIPAIAMVVLFIYYFFDLAWDLWSWLVGEHGGASADIPALLSWGVLPLLVGGLVIWLGFCLSGRFASSAYQRFNWRSLSVVAGVLVWLILMAGGGFATWVLTGITPMVGWTLATLGFLASMIALIMSPSVYQLDDNNQVVYIDGDGDEVPSNTPDAGKALRWFPTVVGLVGFFFTIPMFIGMSMVSLMPTP